MDNHKLDKKQCIILSDHLDIHKHVGFICYRYIRYNSQQYRNKIYIRQHRYDSLDH